MATTPLPYTFDEWPGKKWKIVDPTTVTDVGKDDFVKIVSITGSPDQIKISDVDCQHLAPGKHSGDSWRGIVLDGASTGASGRTTTSEQIEIECTVVKDKRLLTCTSGSGGGGSACWTAEEG